MAISIEIAGRHDAPSRYAGRPEAAQIVPAQEDIALRAAHIPRRCLSRRIVLPHEIRMTVDVEVLRGRSRRQHERREGQIECPTWNVTGTSPSREIRPRIKEQVSSGIRVSGRPRVCVARAGRLQDDRELTPGREEDGSGKKEVPEHGSRGKGRQERAGDGIGGEDHAVRHATGNSLNLENQIPAATRDGKAHAREKPCHPCRDHLRQLVRSGVDAANLRAASRNRRLLLITLTLMRRDREQRGSRGLLSVRVGDHDVVAAETGADG